MEEAIKTFLYYFVMGMGSTSLTFLLIAGLVRSFCFMLDHLKVANVLREVIQLYIKANKDKKITEADIKEEQWRKKEKE